MGIIMTGELFAYGLVSGLLHKKSNYKVEYKHLYPTLVIAMIFSYSGVKGCYGHVMSKEAFEWLTQHNITAHYGTLTEMIQNRKGDGMCPMEQTVKEITDEVEAIEKLKSKVKELSK